MSVEGPSNHPTNVTHPAADGTLWVGESIGPEASHVDWPGPSLRWMVFGAVARAGPLAGLGCFTSSTSHQLKSGSEKSKIIITPTVMPAATPSPSPGSSPSRARPSVGRDTGGGA